MPDRNSSGLDYINGSKWTGLHLARIIARKTIRENPGETAMATGMALTRRGFAGGLAVATAGALAWPLRAPAQGKLETTSMRMVQDPSTCVAAPHYVSQALLREEGFTDIQFIRLASDADDQTAIAEGKADFALDFALKYVAAIDA